MTYQNSMYGEANPSVARKRMLHSLLVLTVLSIYGYVTEFLPSRAWANLGLVFSVLLTIIFSVNIYWALFSRRLKESAKKTVLSRAITFLSLPFFLFAMFWLSLVQALPSLATQIIGLPHTEISSMQIEHRYNRRSCDYRLVGKRLNTTFPNYLCIYISEATYNSLPKDNLAIKLEGETSFFGFRIRKYQQATETETTLYSDS